MVNDVQLIQKPSELETESPAVSMGAAAGLLVAVAAGTLLAALVMPAIAPGLAASLIGGDAKAFWYLSRASAFVAFGLLWASVVFGLLITSRLSRAWPGGPAACDLHQYTSLLAIAFTLFHALILLGDSYSDYTLGQVLVPFASAGYQPLWVGFGQLGLYVAIALCATFYLRARIGPRAWRLIHFASFALFVMALAHGVLSGTDSGTIFATLVYWSAGASVLFLTVFRVLVRR